MTQPALFFLEGISRVWLKVMIATWMFAVIFVYLLLFGSPEFWLFVQRAGLQDILEGWLSWLARFFSAGYLS